MGQRHVALLLIRSAIQIVDLAALQETNCKPSNLIGRSVVDLQLLPSALDVDSALAERDTMAIDPLVRITDDE